MSRSTAKVSLIDIINARQQYPFALGPMLGAVAIHSNLTLASVAKLLHTTEQTVSAWASGSKTVPIEYVLVAGRLVGILTWLYGGKQTAPTGLSQQERIQLLDGYIKDFLISGVASERVA